MADPFDFQIETMKFRLATHDQVPYVRGTAPFRKEQFDSAPTVGDQSLTGWWTRGQLSFHKGAGLKYYEVLEGETVLERFLASESVDVSTPGTVTLRRDMFLRVTQANLMTTYYADPIRHNYVISPSGSTIVGTTSGSGTWTANDTTHAKDAVAFKYVSAGTNNNANFGLDPLTKGETYTARVSVWLATGCPDITFKYLGDTSVSATTATATRDAWQDLTITFTGNAGVANATLLQLDMPGTPPAGSTFWADQLICEKGTSVGTYFDAATTGATGVEGGTGALLDTGVEPWRVLTVYLPSDSTWSYLRWLNPTNGVSTTFSSGSNRTISILVAGSTLYKCVSGWTKPLAMRRLYDNVGREWVLSEGDPITKMTWGKFRLWGVGGRGIYKIDTSIADLGTQTAFFVNPNKDWTYTDIAEGPSAMYVSGHDGNNSSVSAITLNSDGSVPTLSGAQVSAQLPTGELIEHIAILGGGLMGIGTTQGFRVALIDSNGGLTYGPLLFEPKGVLHCTALTTDGTDFLVAFQTTNDGPAIYRVSSVDEIRAGVYAWTRDVVLPTGSYVTNLDSRSGRLHATNDLGYLYVEDDADLETFGYITTGYHRFGTLDQKSFQSVTVRSSGVGTIQVYRVDADGTETSLGTMNAVDGTKTFPIGLTSPVERVAFKFVLNRATATTGPTLLGYQIKALPVPERQHIHKVPLLISDEVTLRRGTRTGHKGKAHEDIVALEALESSKAIVTFTDHRTGETGSAYIDSLDFQGDTPASENSNGFGGVAYVTLRVLG